MKFIGKRSLPRFRIASDKTRLGDATIVSLRREEAASDPFPVSPGTRYRLWLKAEIASSRPDAALIIFNTDQPVSAETAERWFPRYTEAVRRPFAFISAPDADGLVSVSFEAPPNVSRIVFGLRRWAMEGTVRVASALVVETETAGSRRADVIDDLAALRAPDYIALTKAEVPLGVIAVTPGERYVVAAAVENDTGRHDAALLTFTPDVPLSATEASEAFPRFTTAVGKPFAFLDPTRGAGIVSTSFVAPAGATTIALAARRWASGGIVRLGIPIVAVKASMPPGNERSLSLPLPSRAFELLLTPVVSPILGQLGRFDVTASLLDAGGRIVPHSADNDAYAFSRLLVPSTELAPTDESLCAPEFLCAPPQATRIEVRISGSDAHLLPAAEVRLRDIEPSLADELAALPQRLRSRELTLRDALTRGQDRQTLNAESKAALQSLTAVRQALTSERAAAAPRNTARDAIRMKILFVSPRPFGLMGTPGTYHLVEAYARHAQVRVVANCDHDASLSIVHRPAPNLDLHEVAFGAPGYADQIAMLAKEFEPDIVCHANYHLWHVVVERLRREVPEAKYVLDIKSPLVSLENSSWRRHVQDHGSQCAHLLDLVLSRCAEDVEAWIPKCTRPIRLYPLGIKLEQFSPRSRAEDVFRCSRFVFIGSYDSGRKLARMLEFIAMLPAAIRTSITLDMFGNGSERTALTEFVENNGLGKVVRVNDALSQDQLLNILPNYDAGLAWVPRQIYDAAPSLKMLEYFAAGLAVAASATVGQMRNIEEGFRAITFEEDFDSFSHAIEQLHGAGCPRADIKHNLELIKKRDWDSVVTQHLLPAFGELLTTGASSERRVAERQSETHMPAPAARGPAMPATPRRRGKQPPSAPAIQTAPAAAAQVPPTANGSEPGDVPQSGWASLRRNDDAGALDRMLLWSPDVPLPPPQTGPASRLRIACILSDRLFDGLVHEAELLLLTQSTWRQSLRFGRVDMVLVESAGITCTGDWYMAQWDRGALREQLDALLDLARSLGIPTVFWMTLDGQYAHLYRSFAGRFDRVFCADPRAIDGFAELGVRAAPLPPAMQPRYFNPIRSHADTSRCEPGIVYNGWTDLYRFPDHRAVLDRLSPATLSIIDTACMIAKIQIPRIPEGYVRDSLKGWVHRRLLPEIYKRANAYISFSQTTLTPTQAAWSLIEAAACRVPLIHLGSLPADDFRAGFVRQWSSRDDFIADIEAMGDGLDRDMAAHRAWREAQANHGFANRLAAICRSIGIPYDWRPFPSVTLVTGTMRPHLLEKCVRQYLDQTYPNKELVLVYNGPPSELSAIQARYAERGDIVLTALPSDCHAGTLLNFGVRQGTGEYFFRIDDDDHYGPNYIFDCMLYLRAREADIFGKRASLFHFENDNSVYLRRSVFTRIVDFPAKDLHANQQTLISGCAFACRSELLKAIPYPDDINLSADTELIARIKAARPDSRCLLVDNLNLVVERSTEVERHTWQQPASDIKRGSKVLDMQISDMML